MEYPLYTHLYPSYIRPYPTGFYNPPDYLHWYSTGPINALSNPSFSLDDNTAEHQTVQRTKKKGSRCSYIVALMDRQMFIDQGALKITASNPYIQPFDVYYILKMYDGSPCHETCALLGIPLRYWSELILSDSNLLRYIRQGRELSHIQDIYNLGANHHVTDPIHHFRDAFKDILNQYNPDDVILLNIEPRGNGKLERSYPIPLITVPGGRMEMKDFQSFEKCALREFEEETGFNIRNKHVRLCEEKVIRRKIPSPVRDKRSLSVRSFDPATRPPLHPSYSSYSSYTWKHQAIRHQYENDHTSTLMFYLVRIIESMDITPPPGLQ